jgi:hypothetical protein
MNESSSKDGKHSEAPHDHEDSTPDSVRSDGIHIMYW